MATRTTTRKPRPEPIISDAVDNAAAERGVELPPTDEEETMTPGSDTRDRDGLDDDVPTVDAIQALLDAKRAADLAIDAEVLNELRDGRPVGTIAKRLGVPQRHVRNLAAEYGITLAKRGRKSPLPGTPEWDEMQADIRTLEEKWGVGIGRLFTHATTQRKLDTAAAEASA
jgi:hypothetical protein